MASMAIVREKLTDDLGDATDKGGKVKCDCLDQDRIRIAEMMKLNA